MSKLYQTTQWKTARKAFIVGKNCDWNEKHEGPLILDHLTYINPDGSSMNDEQLLEFEKLHSEGKLLILCRRCAFARRNNKVLCKKCGKNYHSPKYNQCFNCLKSENEENYILCKECGTNYHDKKYDVCALCFKKQKRSRAAKKGWHTRRGQGRKK